MLRSLCLNGVAAAKFRHNAIINIFLANNTSVLDPVFFPDPDQTFFLIPDRPKIRIRIFQKSGAVKKSYLSYLALLKLSFLVRLLQIPKPYQNHNLDKIIL